MAEIEKQIMATIYISGKLGRWRNKKCGVAVLVDDDVIKYNQTQRDESTIWGK